MLKLSLVMSLLVLGLLMSANMLHAQQPDVRAAFLASNPSNGWEYGFVNEDGDFVAYNSTFDDGNGIAGWCLDKCPGPLGAISINYSDHPIDEYGTHWEPGQICVLPPMNGLSAVIRWHSPGDATVKVDVTLTAENLTATAGMELSSDGQTLAEGQVGDVANDTNNAHSASVPSSQSTLSDEISRSVVTSVDGGNTIDLVIKSGDEDCPGHIGAAIFISPAGPTVSSFNKASLGKHRPLKQANLFDVESWSSTSAFDALVRRG